MNITTENSISETPISAYVTGYNTLKLQEYETKLNRFKVVLFIIAAITCIQGIYFTSTDVTSSLYAYVSLILGTAFILLAFILNRQPLIVILVGLLLSILLFLFSYGIIKAVFLYSIIEFVRIFKVASNIKDMRRVINENLPV